MFKLAETKILVAIFQYRHLSHPVMTYFFVSFIILEVESSIQLGCILRGALHYIDCASDT